MREIERKNERDRGADTAAGLRGPPIQMSWERLLVCPDTEDMGKAVVYVSLAHHQVPCHGGLGGF